ncbi:MAG: hypothetical protein ACRD1X_14025 [Vicinamibacteria bacterium]
MIKPEGARSLRARLRGFGFSKAALDAAWPYWWSSEADASTSARAELRFSLARKLGLDPRSLIDESAEPRFIWKDEARFKHLAGESEREKAGLTSFGVALGALLVAAAPPPAGDDTRSPGRLRNLILGERRPYVRLLDLISLAWSLGIAVIHLRVFPFPQKRMAAMTVRVGDRFAILLGKDSMYPAPIAFYLAHEIGHIALKHVAENQVLVDLEGATSSLEHGDVEEEEADRYALEMLTGDPKPRVLAGVRDYTSRSLARAVLQASEPLKIEPGTLALCFGYATNDWTKANGALAHVYSAAKPVWREVNRIAATQLSLPLIPDDSADYLRAVLGSR